MTMRTAVALCLIAGLAAGCGGDDEAPPEEATPATEEAEPAAGAADTAPAEAAEAAGEAGAGEERRTAREAPLTAEPSPAATGDLFTVQVGAFVETDGAREVGARIEEAGFPLWTPTARVEGRSFRRVRVGAFRSVADARRLAGILEERFGLPSWVAPVESGDSVTTGMVESSRELLEGR